MEKRIYEELVNTLESGTEFTAKIEGCFVKGKVEVSKERKRIWLCFDKGPAGDRSPNLHGYKGSWVIAHDTFHGVSEFTIILEKESNHDENYPVGAYVVLLSVGTSKSKVNLKGNSIPTDYVYKLRQAYTKGVSGFYIERDTNGSTHNGYSGTTIELREATVDEISAYNIADAPCPAVSTIHAQTTPQIINNYEIY